LFKNSQPFGKKCHIAVERIFLLTLYIQGAGLASLAQGPALKVKRWGHWMVKAFRRYI